MKKSELNQNIHLSEGNIKSQSTDEVMFLTWSLPCKATCPYATSECMKRCFAQKNQYFKSVLESRMKNLEESKKETFVDDMINHFEYHLQRKKTQGKKIFVRIHTSGDFYTAEYFSKWVDIANHFRGDERILFQAYTKSILFVIDWFNGEFGEEYEWTEETVCDLSKINIHLVYSIWHDTDTTDIQIAQELKLQTFTALPKSEISKAVENGSFLCNGDCGNCKECYTGNSLQIVIPYH